MTEGMGIDGSGDHGQEGQGLLAVRPRPSAGAPEGALVFMHGRGAGPGDVWPLLDALDPERRLAGVCPQGPLMLPPGGAHWYVSSGIPTPDRDTFLATMDLLGTWLDKWLAETGVSIDKTIIGGFSQGAVMTYALGLGAGRPRPAGLLPFSGFMPEVEGFELDLAGAAGLPVAIGHGTLDDIISVEWSRAARDRLQETGAQVLYRDKPMPHTIDPAFLTELTQWVREVTAS